MSQNRHVNLSSYDEVEQLENFTEESFKKYCDDKVQGCTKHTLFFKNLLQSDRKHKVCEIGSGNSKLLYRLEKEDMLEIGIGIEISESRHIFAQKFKEYMKSTKVSNLNENIFDIDSLDNFNLIIGVDIVMQLISPISKNAQKDFLTWCYDSLDEGGHLVLELWSFEHTLKQLELSDNCLKIWEEFPKNDPFEYLLSKVSLSEEGDICWDKEFLKRDSNEKSFFSNVLRPYSKEDIKNILSEHGFDDIEIFTQWASDGDCIQDEYVVVARKR